MRRDSLALLVAVLLIAGCSSTSVSPAEETRIVLDRPAFFPNTTGELAALSPGSYHVRRGAGDGIRLTPESGAAAVELPAGRMTHGSDTAGPRAVLLRESDRARRIVLLLPGREGLETWGSTENERLRGVEGGLGLRRENRLRERAALERQLAEALELLRNIVTALQAIVDEITSMAHEIEMLVEDLQEALKVRRFSGEGPATPAQLAALDKKIADLGTALDALLERFEETRRRKESKEGEAEALRARIDSIRRDIAEIDREILILSR